MRRVVLACSSRLERIALALLLCANFALRAVYVFRFRFDTDETQHLHVAWGWGRGLVQYRDVFDNHAPLFHLASAPLTAALGESPRVLYEMRLAMLPVAVALLALCFALGRRLFSPTVGLWAAALAGLWPGFFLRTVEYRPDNAWAALWLLSLAVLVAGRATPARSFAAGLAGGAALAVSVKTLLLAGSLCGAAAVVVLLGPELRLRLRRAAGCAAAAAAGAAVAPAALVLYFAARGALGPLEYGVLGHNSLLGLGMWKLEPARIAGFVALSTALCCGAAAIQRFGADPRLGWRRALVFLAAAESQAILALLWPMREPENAVPNYPLLVLFATAAGAELLRRVSPRLPLAIGTAVAAFEVGALVAHLGVSRNYSDTTEAVLSQVLRLTDVDDPVMDLKGETIFRPRPFYFALEEVTRRKIGRGLIADTIEDCVTRTHTCVAVLDNDYFPPQGRAFLNRAFVQVGQLRVCGGVLPGRPVEGFVVEVAARYALVAERGRVSGKLDGVPYDGPRYLEAGSHSFEPDLRTGRLAFVWAQASERGFTPFPSRQR